MDGMKDKEGVIDRILAGVQEAVGLEDYELALREVLKTGDVRRQAIVNKKITATVSPVVYVDEYAENVVCGNASLEWVIDEVAAVFKDRQIPADLRFISRLEDKDWVLEHVYPRLVNFDKSTEYLKDKVYIRYLDLAIVFYVRLYDGPEFESAIPVKHQVFEQLGITVKELHEISVQNALKDGVLFKSVADILEQLFKKDKPEFTLPINLWALSNSKGLNGAVVCTFPGVLKEISDKVDSDLIIFPSSIHEILIKKITDYDESCYQELRDIVVSINQEQVKPEDVLSDNVYLYDRQTDRILIAE